MQFNEYQKLSSRTLNPIAQLEAFKNYGMGVVGEACEVCDLLYSLVYDGKNVDRYKIADEIGDVLWYLSANATVANVPMEELAVLGTRGFDNFEDYQSVIYASIDRECTISEEALLIKYSLGLTSRAGKLCDYVKKLAFHGHSIDRQKLISKMSPVLEYLTLIALVLRIPMAAIAHDNVRKLQERYPAGFRHEDSVNRKK